MTTLRHFGPRRRSESTAFVDHAVMTPVSEGTRLGARAVMFERAGIQASLFNSHRASARGAPRKDPNSTVGAVTGVISAYSCFALGEIDLRC
jgi:hypothetical protein